ncbi:MFS lactose [Favolaschia claudopus]|uniref:MFS lactose n=1 Tax=Favolaschia claudopus TaxID=2862362 RepID=A0AAW0EF23_9AGAR
MSDSEKAFIITEESRKPERAALVSAPPTQVQDVGSPNLTAALSAGAQLKPLSIAAFKLYLVLLAACMGSLSFGFDSSVVTSVNGMKQFTDYFGISGGDTGGGQGATAALSYSLFSFGCIAGAPISAPISDRWGRRGGMLAGSITLLLGISLVTAAQTRIYLLVGRFFIGAGSALNMVAAPAYVSELAPPQAGVFHFLDIHHFHSAFNFIGSIVCSGVTVATSRINSSLSWRIPFAIQFAPTIILAVGVCFIPESPRWLMSLGRKDEARNILAKYHGNGDLNAPLVVLEYQELEASIKTIGTERKWWDYFNYLELFRSRSARYRTFITCWMGICSLLSGTAIQYYSTVAFDLAGVKTQEARITTSFIQIALTAVGALLGSLIVDKVGRRTLWLWGSASCAVTLGFAAGFTARTDTKPAITFFLLFAFTQSLTYAPLQDGTEKQLSGVYAAECLAFAARAKGIALVGLFESLAAVVDNFTGALGFEAIGWKFILVWAVWDVVETIIIWLFAVETKGRTL